ncbi:hypothetical protein FACS1894179_04750 [Bacteroidia bacterium]|nr:hypothetical protein FACS1894179_04750 [Bacteroidia bacterium]
MKKAILILCSIFFVLQIQSQITAKYSIGYGSYNMSDMEKYMEEAKSAILSIVPGLNIVTTDKFPAYIIHTVNIGYKMQKHEVGVVATYLNTAGKFSYSDYSGKISSEMRLSGYRGGLYYKYNFHVIEFNKNQRLSFYGELSPSLIFTKIKFKEEISPENDLIKGENKDLNNTSLSILPQVGIQYDITSYIGIFYSGGYDINLSSKVKELDNNKVDWSGFRISGGISLSF